jgi:hypothetical protein
MDVDAPWTTLGKFHAELLDWEEKLPDDPELVVIRQWIEEMYPLTPVAPTAAPAEAHFLDGIE